MTEHAAKQGIILERRDEASPASILGIRVTSSVELTLREFARPIPSRAIFPGSHSGRC